VHPGYGFLSENCHFANAITKVGAIWIGPSDDIITTMGDKMAARKLVIDAGAPIVPGTTTPIANANEAKKIAEKIGYPILIKAAGGGGGKGMRIIFKEDELDSAIEQASSEAKNAFSDDRIYIEKYLEEPHHIEIQVFADHHGNIVTLGERECSIQRRYQKIIEETPSPFIDKKLRSELSKTAYNITKSCDYLGAGTIEFLVDKKKNFYFLEMNTRLQVEHPITEMVTGIDLVKEQILVACKKQLSFSQKDIRSKGHAIECRIYAENGFDNFAPSIGTISEILFPHGLGVRIDEGIRAGQKITPYYDPLLAKIITWGENRDIALKRMKRSLNELKIIGIDSSIPFCLNLIKHKTFKNGKYSTDTLDQIKDHLLSDDVNKNKYEHLAARISASKFKHISKANLINQESEHIKNNWKNSSK
jgi:acetyl/propionyl-CoA carboxylase alpha subunit